MHVFMGIDRLAGLVFILLGAIFLWLGLGFGFGSMLRMGPGFFPVILSGLLIVAGLVVLVRSFVADEPVKMPRFGPMARVLGAMVVFAAFMQPLGSYLTLPGVVVLAASASPAFRWKPTLFLAAGLTLCSDLIFRVALGLPLHAVGTWIGG
ncbi:tripartite tricarboxylate transporter TctB family protein [Neorhizobium sp. DT-125]|uniref:tripartite tricarboxylate transporter TctB family protein n=1 Tax=Neorhizobium sp. DT-125 TaxID=3396163 RepID=UPI003F1D8791